MRLAAKTLLAVSLASCVASYGASAQAPASAGDPPVVTAQQHSDTRFTAQDLFALSAASDPQISRDGRTIAYVRRSNDIMTDRARSSIWLIDTRSGAETPLAGGADSDAFAPRWSPDGTRIAYISTAGGRAQLWVTWLASGAAVQLTGLPASPSSITWSPDGQSIAYTMLVPGDKPKLGAAELAKPEGAQWAEPLEIYDLLAYRTDSAGYLKPGFEKIFLISATGGAPRQLTFGDYHDRGPLSFSADGRRLYFSANRRSDWQSYPLESEIHVVDIISGAVTTLTERQGPDAAPLVSPDGRLIAYVGHDDAGRAYENAQVYVMNPDGSGRRSLTANWDFSASQLQWDARSRALYAQYDVRGETRVARIGLDGSVRDVARGLTGGGLDRPYTGGSFSVADNGAIAFTGGEPTFPAEVELTSGTATRRLTNLNAALRDTKTMGEVRKITAPSSHDGLMIDGWLTLPPGYTPGTRVPLILEIHGGPFAAYGPHFASDNQLYASAGYAVLSANPRGSTSYGAAFANQIDKAYPSQDYDDLISIVDAAIAQGIADPDALFVTGGSGGGVLTSWIVGKTDRFKAAATQKPVINWTTQVLTSDNPAFFGRYWLGAQPWEAPELYWRQSPLSLVRNVTTPTLVVVGSNDFRTPVSEAEQYYTALRLRGVPTKFIKVPGASHGGIAARPSQSAAKTAAILAWFDQYRSSPAAAP